MLTQLYGFLQLNAFFVTLIPNYLIPIPSDERTELRAVFQHSYTLLSVCSHFTLCQNGWLRLLYKIHRCHLALQKYLHASAADNVGERKRFNVPSTVVPD